MKKRNFVYAASIVTACAMLLGTNVSAAESINFWFPTFASSDANFADEEFWNMVLTPFEEEHDCDVNVTIVPWDSYEEKYMSGTISSDGPDVGYLYMEMFYDYIENGMLVDIDEYFTDEEKDNYLYYDLGYLLGGQYALPVVVGNPRILIANMDILEEVGISEVPTTLEAFVDTCNAIKENTDYIPFLQNWGNVHYGTLNQLYWPFFWSAGASIVDEDGKLTIDSPEALEATEFILGLKEDGIMPDTVTSCDDTFEPFRNGETAMIYCASGDALRIDNINWDYAAVVEGSEAAETFAAADCLVLFNSCENKELGIELMKYVTSADVMSQFHQEISEQPPITADEDYSGDVRYETLFTEYAGNFRTLPVFQGAASLYDTLYKNLQSMMLGQLSAQEVLTQTADYYNTSIAY